MLEIRCRSVGVLAIGLISLFSTPAVVAQTVYDFNLPSQALADSLRAIGHQTSVNILFDPRSVEKLTAPSVHGQFSASQAVNRVLEGTKLAAEQTEANTLLVEPKDKAGKAQAATTLNDPPDDSQKEAGKKTSQDFRVAQVDQGANSQSASVATKNSSSTVQKSDVLEEVVVTAQKRQERLLDTPQSVVVVSSADLAKLGATQLRDYATSVPGLSFESEGAGYTQMSLRGISAGEYDVGSTVGIYLDEVPYGSSSAFGDGSHATLDAALFDLDRIEVLRGPQGTLYGASSLGGLIKYVINQPDPSAFSGEVQAGLSGTDGGGANYNVASVVNIPLANNQAALRASAFESHDGGYIDNITSGEKDVNRSDVYGGRLDFLMKASDNLTVRLTGFLQNITRDGDGTADFNFNGTPIAGAYNQERTFREPFDQHYRLFNSTVTYDFGPSTLTSVTSYQSMDLNFNAALPGYSGDCAYSASAATCTGIGLNQGDSTDKFSQELRLASNGNGVLTWTVGSFFTHESSSYVQAFMLQDRERNPLPDDLYDVSDLSTFQEYAFFGDLTWHPFARFDVTGGLRYAENDQTYTQIGAGLFGHSLPMNTSSQGVVTYLADSRYHFSNNAIGYIRFATGYRPGGPNIVTSDPVTGKLSGPPTFGSDRLKNYEIGFKAETADKRFGFDVSGYYIDWDNIIIAVIRNGFGAWANAPGGATVKGAELTLTARPIPSLTFSAAGAYTNAYINDADTDIGAAAGERLPNAPRWNGSLNADWIVLDSGWRPTLGASVHSVTDRDASFDFSSGYPQYHLPGYTTVDLRGLLSIGNTGLQLYARNLLNREGEQGAVTWRGVAQIAMLQPRTVGIMVTTHF